VSLFGCAIINNPEGLLEAELTKKGRIEHHFYSMNSVSIVFIEVKKTYAMGRGRLDVIAQALAERAGMSDFSLFFFFLLRLQILTTLLACDYVNSKDQHWLPILAILCDGEKFEFLVYDSVIKSIYASEMSESTGKWMDALARAERAHWLCRKAAELAREGKIKEAEECATRGIDELKERSVLSFLHWVSDK
jgi:hypothetical protein